MYLNVSLCSMYILLVDCMMTCAKLRTWQDFSENLLSDLVLGTRQADRPLYELFAWSAHVFETPWSWRLLLVHRYRHAYIVFTSLRLACRPLLSLMPALAYPLRATNTRNTRVTTGARAPFHHCQHHSCTNRSNRSNNTETEATAAGDNSNRRQQQQNNSSNNKATTTDQHKPQHQPLAPGGFTTQDLRVVASRRKNM